MLMKNDPVNAFVDYDAVEAPSARDRAAQGPDLRGEGHLRRGRLSDRRRQSRSGAPRARSTPRPRRSSQPCSTAGARFVGKTQTDELTFSMNGQNKHFPEPVNVARRGAHHRRLVVRLGGGRRGQASAISPSAPTPAARCARRRAIAGSGASARRTAASTIRARHAARAVVRHRRLFRRRSGRLRARRAGVPRRGRAGVQARRGCSRADDAFARLLSEREAAALKPAEAKVEAKLGPAERVTVAPEGLEHWYWTFRRLQAVEAWKAHGAWIEDPRPRHDARHARALRVRRDGRRRRAADRRRRTASASARASRRSSAPTAC